MDKIITNNKKRFGKTGKYALAGTLLLAFIVFLLFRSNEKVYRIDKQKVTIENVTYGQFNDYLHVSGQVVPVKTIYMDAVEGGRVNKIFIEEGAMVKAGDIILSLENNDLNLNIMNSESSLAYHTNELRNTRIQMEQQKILNKKALTESAFHLTRQERNYNQHKTLYDAGLVSRNDYLDATENFRLAEENHNLIHQQMVQDSIFRHYQKQQMDDNLNNMQVNLSMVRQRLENLQVKAPASGQLGMLNTEIGELINKGQRIGQVNVLESFKIKIEIDEHYIDRVRKGLHGYFTRQNDTFALEIQKQYPEVRDGRFEVDMLFTGQSPNNIRIGQTYHVKLELGKPLQGLLLPRGSFFNETGGNWVYVLDKSGDFATRRNIQLGQQNPRYYLVQAGLQAGEKVITSAYEVFGDNDKIIFK